MLWSLKFSRSCHSVFLTGYRIMRLCLKNNEFFRLTKLSLSTINLSITNSIPVKKYSLGAVYRIKNAESTIELAIRSIIDILDEVVIVDNASSDNTKKLY